MERQNLHKSVEKLKADASGILLCVSKLKDLQKHNEMVEADFEKRSQALDERVKKFEAEKSEASDLKKLVEANIEKRSQELELKEKELQSLGLDLDKRSKMVEADIKKRSLESELKEKELQRLSLELDERCEIVTKEQAEATSLKKMVEANIEKRSLELEFKEKELQSLSLELDERVENFEAEKAKTGDLKKTVDEYTEKLSSKRNQLTMYHRGLEILENKLGEVKAELRRRCSEAQMVQERKREIEEETDGRKKGLASILDQIKESGKQFVAVDQQLESRQSLLNIRSSELDSKEKELESVKESIKLSKSDFEQKQKMVQSLHNYITVCGQKIDSKSKELGDIQKMIEQQTGELGVLNDKIDTKEERYREIEENICRSSSKMEEKAKEIKVAEAEANDWNAKSQRFRQEVGCKEKELDLLKNQIESEEKKLDQFKREMEEETVSKEKDLELILSKIEESGKRHDEILETICRSSSEMEDKAKEIKVAEAEANDLNLRSQRLRKETEDKEKKLGLLQNQIESEETKLIQLKREMEEETYRKKEELELVLDQIKESGKQFVTVDEQLVSRQGLLNIRSSELDSKEKELERVRESIQVVKIDLEVKEKRVQALNNMSKISGEQLDLKSKELEEVQKLIEEERKRLCDMQNQQPSIQSEAEPVCEDSLMHHESSVSLGGDEVSRELRASPNPAEFVLDLVEEEIREGLRLDLSMEILVLFFDELAKIQRRDEPQVQLKAREVAILWKGKITIEAPNSSLEALAFLLFIVAYGLKKLINREETVLLVSSIAQYEQAPTLFNSLGLKLEMVSEFVKELIKKRQYIPAVRFICVFKLNREFSPSHILKEEIINLRQSALGTRLTGSSQAKDKDAGRLRAILELVTKYNLEIDLPGDLVAKLIVQREKLTPFVRCSSSNQQASSRNPVSGYGL